MIAIFYLTSERFKDIHQRTRLTEIIEISFLCTSSFMRCLPKESNKISFVNVKKGMTYSKYACDYEKILFLLVILIVHMEKFVWLS